ncbi:histidinol phosphatase [Flavobacterium amniphilum]|uniref:tyrosine-protein phosphatase n=1 Tax=Flavobacterium amniphilum TaxID=1834035 RepID=UPI00202A16B0|nr:CpsB/CapC family capsule biosynthesis tyrosine phosphatase [Flavobacterium amniphilum]MCL9805121.1 histidinol phosphatase [Flavobacterium amniphilum]
MLFFKKNKVRLKDIIPSGYTDIHSHLLPAIDDGAKNIEDTLQLVNSLKSFGFESFITTPHTFSGFYDNTKAGIQQTESETKIALEKNNIHNNFKAASEYLLDDHFISLCKKGEILTLKDNLVLVEMSYLNAPIHLYDLLFEMQVAGYKPVLAHPERYMFYHKKIDEYKKLKNAGCQLQLNLLSTVGYYGNEVMEVANQLLKNNLIDFVGSDVHHQKHIESFSKKIEIKEVENLKSIIINNQFFKP